MSLIFFIKINIDEFAWNSKNGYFLLKFVGMTQLNGTVLILFQSRLSTGFQYLSSTEVSFHAIEKK